MNEDDDDDKDDDEDGDDDFDDDDHDDDDDGDDDDDDNGHHRCPPHHHRDGDGDGEAARSCHGMKISAATWTCENRKNQPQTNYAFGCPLETEMISQARG